MRGGSSKKQLIIIGGGAAGFFLAANLTSKYWDTLILEQSKQPMQKVKISGGGRCNLTHACFEPRKLAKFYPRGAKELLSVFSRFQPADTFEWFENKGVALKIEEDNRVFPVSDSSQTVIDVLMREAEKNEVQARYETAVTDIKTENGKFCIKTKNEIYFSDSLVIATGSSPKMWTILEKLGHTIVPPVPSLFTFNCQNVLIQNLAGTSFPEAEISIPKLKIKQFGAVMITHWGLSGPAILKLSSLGARELHELNYSFTLRINWISEKFDRTVELLVEQKKNNAKKSLYSAKIPQVTNRFWQNLLQTAGIKEKLWAETGNADINKIADILTNTNLQISGKSAFKEEFVTAGGVDLKEIDFKTMQSKLVPNLYFAGEVLNIDAITGGFNFQACWSEAFIISRNL
ncbi:MAG: NAD(P)/FAD-dependent oxidoreductase [Flavobacteriaceae bacterium]|jgi:predicted Rossmann fold flavoprotein|nr:NAD(P)/FAD-dependent oxidoreductase [Flavobacteriaceae bacterium]